MKLSVKMYSISPVFDDKGHRVDAQELALRIGSDVPPDIGIKVEMSGDAARGCALDPIRRDYAVRALGVQFVKALKDHLGDRWADVENPAGIESLIKERIRSAFKYVMKEETHTWRDIK